MRHRDGQVFVGIANGLGEAITRLILAAHPDPEAIEAVRRDGLRRIANWEPDGMPLAEQPGVAKDAMALFDRIFRDAAARALVLQAAERVERTPLNRRARKSI